MDKDSPLKKQLSTTSPNKRAKLTVGGAHAMNDDEVKTSSSGEGSDSQDEDGDKFSDETVDDNEPNEANEAVGISVSPF